MLAGLLCALLAALTAPLAHGADRIYWTSYKSGKVHWSNLDGSGGIHELNATGAVISPAGYGNGGAIDPVTQRYYWANETDGKINWAALDGSGGGVLSTGSLTVTGPVGVSVDPLARRAYWVNGSAIAYANLDGSGGQVLKTEPATIFTALATTVFPSAGRVYWTNFGFLAGSIAFASTDGSGGQDLKVTGTGTLDTPFGVAIDAEKQRIYWANDNPGIVSVANLDGSNSSDIDRRGLEMKGPYGIALDPEAGIVYTANFAGNTLTALRVDGSGGATLPITLPNESGPNFPVLYEDPRPAAAPFVTSKPPTVPKRMKKGKPAPLPKLIGSKLTCVGGEWRPDLIEARLYRAPTSVAVSWTRDGKAVAGATGKVLRAGRVGDYRCRVTGTNVAGSVTQTSRSAAVFAPGRVKLNVKDGSARLTVLLPGERGGLRLRSKGFESVSKIASGRTTVAIEPTGAKKARLARLGELQTIVRLAYKPPDGPPVVLRKRITLKQD